MAVKRIIELQPTFPPQAKGKPTVKSGIPRHDITEVGILLISPDCTQSNYHVFGIVISTSQYMSQFPWLSVP